jgi:hypothetical protein
VWERSWEGAERLSRWEELGARMQILGGATYLVVLERITVRVVAL